MRAKILFGCFFFLLMSISFAASAPTPINAGILEYGKSYTFNLSFANSEESPQDIILRITPRSNYLQPYTVLSPNSFTFGPKETRTVKVTFSASENIGPGEHIITILPEESIGGAGMKNIATGVAEIKFTLPGETLEGLELKSIAQTTGSGRVRFDLTVKNTGNVRVGAFPVVELRRYYGSSDVTIKTIRGATQYLIEPGQEKALTVYYDSGLEKGEYKAIAKASYSGKFTNELFRIFDVGQKDLKEDTKASDSDRTSAPSGGVSPITPITYSPSINMGTIPGDNTSLNQANTTRENAQEIELRISRLETQIVSKGAVSIMLGIENLYAAKTPYRAKVTIFNESGEQIEEFSRSGEIAGNEMETIELASASIGKGRYKIEAALEYANKTVERIYIAEISFDGYGEDKSIIGDYSSLTGNFISAISQNLTTILLLIAVLLLGVIYFRGRDIVKT